MLEITWETFPNKIIMTILFVYTCFYQYNFSRSFSLPQGGTCKDSESSSNRQLSGVTGVLSVTLEKSRLIVPSGDIKQWYSGYL